VGYFELKLHKYILGTAETNITSCKKGHNRSPLTLIKISNYRVSNEGSEGSCDTEDRTKPQCNRWLQVQNDDEQQECKRHPDKSRIIVITLIIIKTDFKQRKKSF